MEFAAYFSFNHSTNLLSFVNFVLLISAHFAHIPWKRNNFKTSELFVAYINHVDLVELTNNQDITYFSRLHRNNLILWSFDNAQHDTINDFQIDHLIGYKYVFTCKRWLNMGKNNKWMIEIHDWDLSAMNQRSESEFSGLSRTLLRTAWNFGSRRFRSEATEKAWNWPDFNLCYESLLQVIPNISATKFDSRIKRNLSN